MVQRPSGMDSQTTTTPPTHGSLAAMFQNVNIDKAEKRDSSNNAYDMFKAAVNNHFNFTKEGENMVLESSDVIDFFRHVVQPFLAEVHKNDQSRSTVGNTTSADGSDPLSQAITTCHAVEGDLVDIIGLVPSEPSLLPVASVADRYTRSMLKCLAGYPLYEPQPFSELSTEYLRHGVNVGDVGFVREDGIFDFLFNICLSKNGLINPPNLPDGFSLETVEHSATRPARALSRKTCLFQSPITRTKSGEYICEGPEGAILELPEGAIQEEAANIFPFEKLAARHGVQWYEYTMARGRKISNGSLYLITSFTKCAQWGIAVLDRPCVPGEGLRFEKKRSRPSKKSTSKYHWKGSHTFPTKISDLNQKDAPNQCAFLRGYKIMIRQAIFDNICNGQPHGSDPVIPSSSSQARSINLIRQLATHGRSGGGPDPTSEGLTDGGLLSWTRMTSESMTKPDDVVLHANFNSSLVHPSDLINTALLNQNPGAKVALTHDDVWCDLLRDNFPKLNYATLMNTARSYTNIVDEYDCVSLEKSSDSSNDLEESYRPLHGIKTPALQATLTTSDDGNTATISVPLPRELVERILLLLDTESIQICKLVNRELNEIIQSSILLQYFLACKAAGVIDNPQSPLSYAERLEALKKREEAWRMLKPVFEMAIDGINQTASSICFSSEGIYFLSDHNLKDLNYCHLTSFPQDIPRWNRVPGHGPALGRSGILVNFAAALYEHDLIVNLISSDIGNQTDMQRHSLDLVLLKFSTREYHPLARHPQIHVQRSSEVKPWVVPRIVGNHLALVIRSRNGRFTDKLFIFDWKTGHKRLQHEATASTYLTLDFISPELLLIPNLILFHLEIWHLPLSHPNSTPPVQILSILMPPVSPEYSLFDFGCRAEPKLFFHSTTHFPPRPFFSSPESSIIVVRLRMLSVSSISRRYVSYNLVMHRRALLDTIQKWTSPSFLEQQEYLLTLTNKVTVHQIADSENGSVQLDAQSELASPIPHPRSSPPTRDFSTFVYSRTLPTSHISTNSGSSTSLSSGLSKTSSTSRCPFFLVPWAEWGPPISRWFQLDETQARWFGHYNGQRYAFSEPNPLDIRKLIVHVADFNPYNSRRHAEMIARLRSGEGDNNGSNGNNEEGKEEEEEKEYEVLDHKGVFSEEVYMGLKCVVYRAPGEYDFDLVLMDEQRLFGVKLNGYGWEESIKVLYIG